MSKCVIIYGFLSLEQIEQYKDYNILLIEPRKVKIDYLIKNFIGTMKFKNVQLISKVITDNNNQTQEKLYCHSNLKLSLNSNSGSNLKSESVFTTNFPNIISQFDILTIQTLVLNLDIDNLTKCLDTLDNYNYIISHIFINTSISQVNLNTNLLLQKFIKESHDSHDFIKYSHKNLNIPIPKMCLYNWKELDTPHEISKLYSEFIFVNNK